MLNCCVMNDLVGTSLTLLGDIPHEALGREVLVPLGDLFAGSERILCLEALIPSSKKGTAHFGIELTYQGQTEEGVTVNADAIFTYAGETEVMAARHDLLLRNRAVELHVATVEARALRMAEDGRSTEAAKTLLFAIDCCMNSLESERVTELRDLADKLEQSELSVMESKTRHDISYKRRYSR